VTFETDDNYSIRFEISNNSSTIRFDSKWKKHYSHSTNHTGEFTISFFPLHSPSWQLTALTNWKNCSMISTAYNFPHGRTFRAKLHNSVFAVEFLFSAKIVWYLSIKWPVVSEFVPILDPRRLPASFLLTLWQQPVETLQCRKSKKFTCFKDARYQKWRRQS